MDKKRGLFSIKDSIYLIITPLVIILPITYWYLSAPPLGWCKSEGRILSDQEKIENVIAVILKEYPKEGDSKLFNSESYEPYYDGVQMRPAKYPVPYHDINEFLALNPTCCNVVQHYVSPYKEGGEYVSFFDHFTGRKTAVISIKYLLRYKDESGEIQSKPWDYATGMDNCGKLVWDF